MFYSQSTIIDSHHMVEQFLTLWFEIKRSREEHVQLRWGDLELKKNKGEEYLEHTERVTKSRTVMTRNVRPFGARMFVDPGNLIWGNIKVQKIIYFI